MQYRMFFRFCLLIWAVTLTDSALAQNLVRNGGFDLGLDGWYNDGPGSLSWDAQNDCCGELLSGSAKLTYSGYLTYPTLNQCIPVTAGTTYDFSFWTGLGGNQGIVLDVDFFSLPHCAGSSLAVHYSLMAQSFPNWVQFQSLNNAAPPSAASAVVRFQPYLFSDALRVDNVVVRPSRRTDVNPSIPGAGRLGLGALCILLATSGAVLLSLRGGPA